MSLAYVVAGRFYVWATDKDIIRVQWKDRFKTPYWRHHERRKVRHRFYRDVLKAHHENQELCRKFTLRQSRLC